MPKAKKLVKPLGKVAKRSKAAALPRKTAATSTQLEPSTKPSRAVAPKTNKPTAGKHTTKTSSRKMLVAGKPPLGKRPAANAASTKGAKPTTIDEYLGHVDSETRHLLEGLRATIKRLEPEVEECISYAMPAFRYQGKVIAGFAATSNGASYYPFSGTTLSTLSAALKGHSQTKAGLHFTKETPLSEDLVRQLLEARKAEL